MKTTRAGSAPPVVEATSEGHSSEYWTGKGARKQINLSDILRIDTSPDRLQFSFRTKQGRDYLFRVETCELLSYWVRGL